MLIALILWAQAVKISQPNQATIDSDPYQLGYDLRTSASLVHSLWREVTQKTSQIQNLLAVVQHRTSDLENMLIQIERSRNQLMYQCRSFEPISFSDLTNSPTRDLKTDFLVSDPIDSDVQSQWKRGALIQSRTSGSSTIEQKTIWPSESPITATALLLRRSLYTVGQTLTQVGIRPLSKDRMAAGLTIGWKSHADFYFAYLDLHEADCAVRFGLVTNGICKYMKNMTCTDSDRFGSYKTLTFVSQPLEFRFYLDAEPIGSVKLAQADYREGSAGAIVVTGSANFAGLSIGPPLISPKIAYSADPGRRDWREQIVELYSTSNSKTTEDDTTGASQTKSADQLEQTAYHCTTYKPTHILPEDLICSDLNYWRFENSVNGTAIASNRDLKASDELQQCIVSGWSCRDSEIVVRLTFNSDGEAGIILRSHNDTLFTMVTIETVSQKVTLSEMRPASGIYPIWQMVSSVPIVSHEINQITVGDLSGKISVALNDAPLFETWVSNTAEKSSEKIRRVAYAGGFVVRRGNVEFQNLSMRGL